MLNHQPSVSETSTRRGARIVFGLKSAVAAVVLYFLVWSGRLDTSLLLRATPLYAILVLVLSFLAMFIPAIRWWILLRAQNVSIRFSDAVRITWISYFATLFLPGAAAGDVAKGLFFVRGSSAGRLKSLSTVVVDRLLGLYSLMAMAGIACIPLFFSATDDSIRQRIAFGIVVMWMAATIAMFSLLIPSMRSVSMRLLPFPKVDSIWQLYQAQRGVVTEGVMLSLLSSILTLAALGISFVALHQQINLQAVCQVGPLAILANCLPLTPGGLGVGEAASEAAFNMLGISGGAEAMLLVRFATILCSLPGGLASYGSAVGLKNPSPMKHEISPQ